MVLDDYGMSFVINTGIWLVSLDCLNTLIMIKFATEIVIPDYYVGYICHYRTGRRNVKDDMPHNH